MSVFSKRLLLVLVYVVFVAARAVSAAIVAQPQGAHLTQGVVTGVHRVNGQAAFHVRTFAMNNAGPVAANQNIALGVLAGNQNGAAAALPVAQRFLVGPGTMFEASLGGNLMPASFAALRSGQRVMIQSEGAQAMRVRIVGSQRNLSRGRGMRTMGYPANMYRQRAMRPSAMAVVTPTRVVPTAHIAKPSHAGRHVK